MLRFDDSHAAFKNGFLLSILVLLSGLAIFQKPASHALSQAANAPMLAPAQARTVATDPNLKIAFVGDSAYGTNFRNVLTLIKNEGASATVHLGDFDYVYDADGFIGVMDSVLGTNYPYFLVVGNHDIDTWRTGCGDTDGCYAQFAIDRMQRLGITPDSWDLNDQTYSITYRGLKFVFGGQESSLGDSVYAPYMDNQLANDNHIWQVCGWHKNQQAMQIGGKVDETGWGVYETCRQRGAIIATAHEHSYERTRTLTSMSSQVVDAAWPDASNLRIAPGSTFAFVSGLGGHSIRNQQRCLPTTYPYGCNGEWASIYTTNQGADYGALFIIFNVGGDPYKAQGYFKTVGGQIIDQFTITAQPNGAPVATPTQAPTPTSTVPTYDWLLNGSFEADSDGNGIPDNWVGRNMNQDMRVCDAAHTGACAFRFGGTNGTRGELEQTYNQAGKAGEAFTFRLWTKGQNAVNNGTYRVRTMFYHTDGTYGSFTYNMQAGTTDWHIFERSFKSARAYKKIVVTIMYGGTAGNVWYDDVILLAGTLPPPPTPMPTIPAGGSELVVNGSYEADADNNGMPDSWSGRNITAGNGRVCDVAHDGGCSVLLKGGASREVYQRFNLAGNAGDTFVFRVWTRSENAGAGGTYRVRVTVYYNNGTYEGFTSKLTAGTSDWTQFQRVFTPTRSYYRIQVSVLYGEVSGMVWFDQVSLTR